MSWIANLSVGRRLAGAFGAIAAVMLALGIVAVVALSNVTGSYEGLIAHRANARAGALALQTDIAREAAAFRGYVLTGKDDFLTAFTASKSDFTTGVAALKTDADRSTTSQLDHIAATHATYLDTVALARTALQSGDKTGAAAIIASKVQPANDAAQATLDPFVKAQGERLQSGNASASATASSATWIVLGGLIAALALAVALTWLITRSIVRPLRRLEDATSRAAEGDLTVQVGSESRDELGIVSRSFDAMTASLREIVGRVVDAAHAQAQTSEEMAQASEQTGLAVSQIASTVSEVARGAGEQALSTQSVTETVEEMTRGIEQVARGGASASAVAGDADAAALEGAETVDAATRAMQRIEASVAQAAEVVTTLGGKSQAIGQIVSTIGDIASQTNLLALNAAIEAARAGEQGRGFAVVAEEVRKLAESTQEQAGSIAGLIGEIQTETERAVEAMSAGRSEVEEGAARVNDAGGAFETIRELVVRLSGEVVQVAAAAQELEAGAQQVQEGVSSTAEVSQENAAAAEQVAASTQETAASSEQISASAQQLAGAAEQLSEMVARFTT